MKLILLDEKGNLTKTRFELELHPKSVSILPPLSDYWCCEVIDPIIGEIKMAISEKFNRGTAKFVINNHEIHSKVSFNVIEKSQFEKIF